MTHAIHALYPILLASADVALAGLLYLVAPAISVVMAAVGILVVCVFAHQALDYLDTAVRSVG